VFRTETNLQAFWNL